jgi:rare lipoprotein A
LPLGAVATVRNLENGRWVRVRINDRGPFKPNRVIDLSRAAARHLDIVEDGLARVSIEAHAADMAWDPDGPRPVREPG